MDCLKEKLFSGKKLFSHPSLMPGAIGTRGQNPHRGGVRGGGCAVWKIKKGVWRRNPGTAWRESDSRAASLGD